MNPTLTERTVTIRLSSEGFKVEFEGAMWGRRYINLAHRAMLRSFPRYLAEAKKKGIGEAEKGEMKDGERNDSTRSGEGQGFTARREGEGLVDREEGRVGEVVNNEGGVDNRAVQCNPRPDGGAGQNDRTDDELLEKGEVIERPRHRRASSRGA